MRVPDVPEPIRGIWLIGVYPSIIAAVLADPSGAIASHGFYPLVAMLAGAGVAQVATIRSEIRAKGWR